MIGSAVVTLNSGQMHLFKVKGLYKRKNQQSRLVLSGVGLSKNSVLRLAMNRNSVVSINGKIAGQAISITN